MAIKKCKECGKDVSSGAKVCPHCGKKLKMGFLKKILIGFGIFFVFIIFIGIISNGSSSSNSTKTAQIEPAQQVETINAKIGDELSIGNFVYCVESISFKKTIGNEVFNKTADGIYLLIKLTLKNIDKKAHSVDNSIYKLIDTSGTEYESSSDGSTAIELSGGKTLFLKQCQPNIQTQGYLVFEVPSKENIYHLKVSGGFWSGKTGDIILH